MAGRDTTERKAAREEVEAGLDQLQDLAENVEAVQQLFYSKAVESKYKIDDALPELKQEAKEELGDTAKKKMFSAVGDKIDHLIQEKQAHSLQHHGLANVAVGAFVHNLQDLQQKAAENGIDLQTTVRYVYDENPKSTELGEANPEKDLVEVKVSYKTHKSAAEGRRDIELTIPAAFLSHDLSDLAQTIDEDGRVIKGEIDRSTRAAHDKKVQAFLDSPKGQKVQEWQKSIDTSAKLEEALNEKNAALRTSALLNTDEKVKEAAEFLSPSKIAVDQLPEALREEYDAKILAAKTREGVAPAIDESSIESVRRQLLKPVRVTHEADETLATKEKPILRRDGLTAKAMERPTRVQALEEERNKPAAPILKR